jgi:hypothetical protein
MLNVVLELLIDILSVLKIWVFLLVRFENDIFGIFSLFLSLCSWFFLSLLDFSVVLVGK